MSRTKKSVKQNNTTSTEKVQHMTAAPAAQVSQNLGYQGIVTLTVKKGNTTLNTKKFYNTGCQELFKFIANCLAGIMQPSLHPCKIKLFTGDAEESRTDPSFSEDLAISSFKVYDDAADIEAVHDGLGYTTTFHFKIPSSMIENDKDLYKLAIYPAGATESEKERSAQYLLQQDSFWSPLLLSEIPGNYTLFIDWAMTVTNQIKN